MRNRPPFIVLWTVALVLAATVVVLGLSRPWSAGAATAPAAAANPTSAPAAAPTVHKIAIVGDSYTGGSNMGGSGDRSWVADVARTLHDRGIEVEAWRKTAGGSGYVAQGVGEPAFGALVPLAVQPDTEVVVFFGSRNDSGQTAIEAGAEAAFRQALQISPKASLLVIGPAWVDDKPPRDLQANSAEVRAAAAAVGATFVDPLADGWFTGKDSNLIGSDGIHPTDSGHGYMADQILPFLQGVIESRPAA